MLGVKVVCLMLKQLDFKLLKPLLELFFLSDPIGNSKIFSMQSVGSNLFRALGRSIFFGCFAFQVQF